MQTEATTAEEYDVLEEGLSLMILLMAEAGLDAIVTRPDKTDYKRQIICMVPTVISSHGGMVDLPTFITQAEDQYDSVEIYQPLRPETKTSHKHMIMTPVRAMGTVLKNMVPMTEMD